MEIFYPNDNNLYLPSNKLSGPTFDILARKNTIINAFICDLAFSSIYGIFQKHKKYSNGHY
jgi:hypothetical protein